MEDFANIFKEILSIPKKKEFTMREVLSVLEDILFDLVNGVLFKFFVSESDENWKKPMITNPNADFLEEAKKNYEEYLEKEIERAKNPRYIDHDDINQIIDYDLINKISNFLVADLVKSFLKYYNQFKYDSKNIKPTNRKNF